MGFLDRFKGKKPTVTLAAEPLNLVPGQQVRLNVVVGGEIDDKSQSAQAGIRCVNEFLTKEYDRQEHEWDEVWRSITLHEDMGDVPLEVGEHELTFAVPGGLPPSSKEAVKWSAWTKIDRSGGFDAKADRLLAVRLPSGSVPSERRAVAADKDGVSFDDLPASVGGGQTLQGTLSVTPAEDVKTTGVKVKLTRTRRYRHDNHKIDRSDDVAEVEVAPGQELAAGQTHQFQFALPVPTNPGPTAQAPHAVVEWKVTGVVARRMKLDLDVEAPIVVFDGP
jgi:SpoOM protein